MTNNIFDENMISSVTNDILMLFDGTGNKKYLTKSECYIILDVVFETLFDEKLKLKNFDHIYNLLLGLNSDSDSLSTQNIHINFMEPVSKAFIICFDVSLITNSDSFQDKVCIKIGKYMLPSNYYIKKLN